MREGGGIFHPFVARQQKYPGEELVSVKLLRGTSSRNEAYMVLMHINPRCGTPRNPYTREGRMMGRGALNFRAPSSFLEEPWSPLFGRVVKKYPWGSFVRA